MKLKTIPYTDKELFTLSKDECLAIKEFRYEKTIGDEIINILNFNSIVEANQKILELCRQYEPEPLILLLETFPFDSFIVEKKYHSDDPQAIFENIFYTIQNINEHDSGNNSISKKINTLSDINKVEIIRVIGSNIHKVTKHGISWIKLHNIPEPIYASINLIPNAETEWKMDNA